VVMAPFYDGAGVKVPGQVDEEAARGQVLGQYGIEVLFGDPHMAIFDAPADPSPEGGCLVLEINYGDIVQGYLHMLQKNGESASSYRAKSNYQYLAIELHHR
jgi:hypothetical protein